MFRQMVSPQIMRIFLPMLKSNIESSVNKKKNPEFSLSERAPSRSFRVSGYPLNRANLRCLANQELSVSLVVQESVIALEVYIRWALTVVAQSLEQEQVLPA